MQHKQKIKKIISEKKDLLGLASVKGMKISLLGIGEINLNYRVDVGKQSFVFRIGLRKDQANLMYREFEILKMLPKGVGPRPIYMDLTKKLIPNQYSILSYVKGRTITNWTKKHLQLHAKALAQIHKINKKGKVCDLRKSLEKEVKSYASVMRDKDIKELLPVIRKYIKENYQSIAALKKFSFTHGDMYANNILFSKNKIAYIDWEHANYEDPAIDLVRVGWSNGSYVPWTLKFTKEQEQYLVKEYLKHRKDKTIQQRMAVWRAYVVFVDLLFFKWKLQNWKKEHHPLPKRHYEKTVRLMVDALKRLYV